MKYNDFTVFVFLCMFLCDLYQSCIDFTTIVFIHYRTCWRWYTWTL